MWLKMAVEPKNRAGIRNAQKNSSDLYSITVKDGAHCGQRITPSVAGIYQLINVSCNDPGSHQGDPSVMASCLIHVHTPPVCAIDSRDEHRATTGRWRVMPGASDSRKNKYNRFRQVHKTLR